MADNNMLVVIQWRHTVAEGGGPERHLDCHIPTKVVRKNHVGVDGPSVKSVKRGRTCDPILPNELAIRKPLPRAVHFHGHVVAAASDNEHVPSPYSQEGCFHDLS